MHLKITANFKTFNKFSWMQFFVQKQNKFLFLDLIVYLVLGHRRSDLTQQMTFCLGLTDHGTLLLLPLDSKHSTCATLSGHLGSS